MLALKCGKTVMFCQMYTHKSTHISIMYLTITIIYLFIYWNYSCDKYSTHKEIFHEGNNCANRVQCVLHNLQYAFT